MIEINFHPERRDLRVFGLLLGLFLAIIAGLAWRRDASGTVIGSLLGAGAAAAVVALVVPSVLRYIYVPWMIAVFPIGWVVSHVVLAIVFFGVVMPIGVWLRWRGQDPMERSRDPKSESYWKKRPPAGAASTYFRPF